MGDIKSKDFIIIFQDGASLNVKNCHIDSKQTPGIIRFIDVEAYTILVVAITAIKYIQAREAEV